MFETDESLPPILRSEGVIWLSPSEISNETIAISNEPLNVEDVLQGFYGGHFLAGVITLVNTDNENSRFFRGVWRNDGLLEYAFYKKDGETVRVRINSLLPTRNGKLVFAQAPNNEFWCPLLEKAYAKFLGGYQYLSLGTLSEVTQPLTGNFLNCYGISGFENNTISNWIRNECEKNHPIICKTKHSNGNNGEHGRGFAVIGVTSSNNEDLICVRDPMKTTSETIRVEDFKKDFDLIGTSDSHVSSRVQNEIVGGTVGGAVGGAVRSSQTRSTPILFSLDNFGRNPESVSIHTNNNDIFFFDFSKAAVIFRAGEIGVSARPGPALHKYGSIGFVSNHSYNILKHANNLCSAK